MPVIGTFSAVKDGYVGTIRTLTMTAKVSRRRAAALATRQKRRHLGAPTPLRRAACVTRRDLRLKSIDLDCRSPRCPERIS
jgi:hypothetical protein